MANTTINPDLGLVPTPMTPEQAFTGSRPTLDSLFIRLAGKLPPGNLEGVLALAYILGSEENDVMDQEGFEEGLPEFMSKIEPKLPPKFSRKEGSIDDEDVDRHLEQEKIRGEVLLSEILRIAEEQRSALEKDWNPIQITDNHFQNVVEKVIEAYERIADGANLAEIHGIDKDGNQLYDNDQTIQDQTRQRVEAFLKGLRVATGTVAQNLV